MFTKRPRRSRLTGRPLGAAELRDRASAVLAQPYAPALWHHEELRPEAPWYFARGEGARLWDHDGRSFLDLEMGLGPVLLGYDHPVVRGAMRRLDRTPAISTLLHQAEVEVAELLVELLPSAELVTFGKNGSDACTAAVRVARAVTGRNTIVSSGFHGIHDWFVADAYPTPGVVPSFAGYLKDFAFNDVEGLERLAAEHASDLAAIMIDPANRLLPAEGFLEAARRFADEHGAVLIFDEVMTAFRFDRGGVQSTSGVVPDLTCVGKAMANGMPVSALVGRREVMHAIDRVFYALTFQHESVSLGVASACLQHYRDTDVVGEVATRGEVIRALYDAASAAAGLEGRAVGPAVRMDLDFCRTQGVTPFEQQVVFCRALVERGVLPTRVVLPCVALSDDDLEQVGSAFDHAFREVARLIDRRSGTS